MHYLLVLDQTDDLSSVRKRLADIRGGLHAEVGIVIPPDNMAFADPSVRLPESFRLPSQEGGGPLNFRLLKRHARALSLHIAIIAAEREMRMLAIGEGLPSFPNVKSYRRHVARRRAIENNPVLSRVAGIMDSLGVAGVYVLSSVLKLVMVLCLLVILGIVAYGLLPSATVTISPESENLDVTLNVRADPATRSPVLAATSDGEAQIPARSLQAEVEAEKTIPVSGVKYAPNARASGQVSFFNKTNQEVTLPRGTTVIANGGQRFQTVDDVTLPGTIWSVRKVAILAEIAGSAGNVEELQINHVAGPLDLQVVVVNEGKTYGGDERKLTVVSQEDKENLRSQLLDQLQREAVAKLQSQPEVGGQNGNAALTLVQPSLRVDVEDEFYNAKVNQEASNLTLKMKVRASALAFDYRDVTTLSDQFWSGRVKPGFAALPGTQQMSQPKVVRMENGTALMHVSMQGTIAAIIDEGSIQEMVRGRPASEAAHELASTMKLASEPRISIAPAWIDRALRVQVVIDPAK